MTSKLVAGLASALLLSACQASTGQESNHWNIESLAPRTAKAFLGYRQDLDGSYREFQWRQKQDMNLTLRRHFLNDNPNNPFQADDPSVVAARPPHSILPDPLQYFHVESLTTGLILLAWTGTFIPIPFGSIIATIEDGGAGEFADGIHDTFTGSFGTTLDQPPSVSEFRVRSVR